MMKNFARFLALLLAVCALCGAAAAESSKKEQYDAAMALYKAREFEQALEAFLELGSYEDSRSMANKSKWYWQEDRYKQAKSLYSDGSYQEAKEIFDSLGSFEESKKYARKCERGLLDAQYEQAEALMETESYEAALEIFLALGDHSNSRKRAEQAQKLLEEQKQAAVEQEYYRQALAHKEAGELEKARDAFVLAGQDTPEATDELYEVLEVLAQRYVYARAEACLTNGQYEEAICRFETLGSYEDSAARAADALKQYQAALYEHAKALEQEQPAKAYVLYLFAGHEDSFARADALAESMTPKALYTAAGELEKEGFLAAARTGYEASGYKDSETLVKELDKNSEFERAHILTELWQLEEANALYKSLKGFKYASRMGIERLTAKQLRDDATSEMSEVFTAPDGTRHTYRIYKGVFRWIEAKAFCQALGGHLATLTTPEENKFVYWFMRDSGFTTAYFGLEDEERKHNWKWVTGEPFEYTNWDSNEPSYSGRLERYGMYFYKHVETWNDAHFYEDTEYEPGCSYICEWDY